MISRLHFVLGEIGLVCMQRLPVPENWSNQFFSIAPGTKFWGSSNIILQNWGKWGFSFFLQRVIKEILFLTRVLLKMIFGSLDFLHVSFVYYTLLIPNSWKKIIEGIWFSTCLLLKTLFKSKIIWVPTMPVFLPFVLLKEILIFHTKTKSKTKTKIMKIQPN